MAHRVSLFPPAKRRQPQEESDLQSLLGPPPLLEGEDAVAYDALKSRILSAVKPQDAIEEIWVRDILDLLWETTRLRRQKAKLMHASARSGLYTLLRPLVDDLEMLRAPFLHDASSDETHYASLEELIRGWVLGEPEAVKEVKQILGRAGLDKESIAAQTLAVNCDVFEKIDRMIMQTEARRHVVLREIDRRRDALARRLREVSAEIVDGKFAVIAPPDREAAE
jgi:hypothetical protein